MLDALSYTKVTRGLVTVPVKPATPGYPGWPAFVTHVVGRQALSYIKAGVRPLVTLGITGYGWENYPYSRNASYTVSFYFYGTRTIGAGDAKWQRLDYVPPGIRQGQDGTAEQDYYVTDDGWYIYGQIPDGAENVTLEWGDLLPIALYVSVASNDGKPGQEAVYAYLPASNWTHAVQAVAAPGGADGGVVYKVADGTSRAHCALGDTNDSALGTRMFGGKAIYTVSKPSRTADITEYTLPTGAWESAPYHDDTYFVMARYKGAMCYWELNSTEQWVRRTEYPIGDVGPAELIAQFMLHSSFDVLHYAVLDAAKLDAIVANAPPPLRAPMAHIPALRTFFSAEPFNLAINTTLPNLTTESSPTDQAAILLQFPPVRVGMYDKEACGVITNLTVPTTFSTSSWLEGDEPKTFMLIGAVTPTRLPTPRVVEASTSREPERVTVDLSTGVFFSTPCHAIPADPHDLTRAFGEFLLDVDVLPDYKWKYEYGNDDFVNDVLYGFQTTVVQSVYVLNVDFSYVVDDVLAHAKNPLAPVIVLNVTTGAVTEYDSEYNGGIHGSAAGYTLVAEFTGQEFESDEWHIMYTPYSFRELASVSNVDLDGSTSPEQDEAEGPLDYRVEFAHEDFGSDTLKNVDSVWVEVVAPLDDGVGNFGYVTLSDASALDNPSTQPAEYSVPALRAMFGRGAFTKTWKAEYNVTTHLPVTVEGVVYSVTGSSRRTAHTRG